MDSCPYGTSKCRSPLLTARVRHVAWVLQAAWRTPQPVRARDLVALVEALRVSRRARGVRRRHVETAKVPAPAAANVGSDEAHVPGRHGRGGSAAAPAPAQAAAQAVIDAELSFENKYPLENNRGKPVPIAWGVIASGDHNGKEMLENPARRIRID